MRVLKKNYMAAIAVGNGTVSMSDGRMDIRDYDDYLYQDSVIVVILPDGTQYEAYITEE